MSFQLFACAHIHQSPAKIHTPIVSLSKSDLKEWSAKVISATPPDPNASRRPRIVARDVPEAARILNFLVAWLFEHEGQAHTRQLAESFRAAFQTEFGERGPVCDLTSLPELIRNARGLDVRM